MAGFLFLKKIVPCIKLNAPMIKQFCILIALLFSAMGSAQELKKRQAVLYFDVDIDKPLPEGFTTLLAELKTARVTRIYGHTDTTATAAYNQALSERRAKNVAAVIKKNGINLSGVEVKGFGETQSTESGLITDRRVVIYYEITDAATPQPVSSGISIKEQIKTAKVGDKINLKSMRFENNSDFMLPSSRPVANELLKIMKDNPRLKIDIQGHICCDTVDVNQISRLRALAVYNFLIKNGIKKDRLSYQSFGSTRPLYSLPEKTEDEKTANRRVEIQIIEN
jgi:outer membrane protein OmpA-like peptidoglycan-associated protein